MQTITIENREKSLSLRAGYCTSFACRLRGLTFKRDLPSDWGLLLVGRQDSKSDASIHMLFMMMDLAVVWINSAQRVVDVRRAWRWRSMIIPQAPAKYVLELPVDRFDDFEIGDELHFETS
jgi:hypothetical protein